MNEELCPVCGGRNPPNTQFCNICGNYLGWDKEPRPGAVPGDRRGAGGRPGPEAGSYGNPGGGRPPPRPGAGSGFGPAPGPGLSADATRAIPTLPRKPASSGWGTERSDWGSAPSAGGRADIGHGRGADPTDFQAEVEQQEAVVVTPGAPPSPVTVHIANTSTVVEAYHVAPVNPPPWLIVTPGQVRLLPGTDERVSLTLAIAAENLVPVQRFRVHVRIQAESSKALFRDAFVECIVGTITAPAQLRLEPSNVRIRDATTATFRVLLDNRRSNVPLTVDLAGRDPEHQVRFTFHPIRVQVPPGGTAAAGLRVDAPLPPAGEQLNRTLTVIGASGDQEITANAGFIQAASAVVVDPPMQLRLDPSVVHANRRSGLSHIVLDNRRGSRPQRVRLDARDVENVVQCTIVPQELEVPAGQFAMAKLSMQAPRPEPGEEVARSLIVSAWNGRETVETQGELLQATPARKPFLRVLLTLLGSLAMIFGSFLPWTVNPEGAGVQWGYLAITRFLRVPTDPVDSVLNTLGALDLVDALITVGGFTLLFGILAALGLLGDGRLIRKAAVFGVIILALFAGAMIAGLFVNRGFPGLAGGYFIVLAGCVTAYIGSYFARP